MANYDTWKATEPPESGEACIDCHRREATGSDGRCEECADLASRPDDDEAPLSLTDELFARELAADAGEEWF